MDEVKGICDNFNKMVHPSPSWCLSFLIILLYLVVIQQLRGVDCRIVEQLTDSVVYISPYFLDYWSYSQFPQL